MAQLRPHVQEIRALGELVVIGSGTADKARDFQQQFSIDFPVHVDPSRAAFRAAGLKRGVLSTFSARALVRGIGALRSGARQGTTQGDPWQQGGALLLAPGGRVAWEHRNADPSDHPPIDAMLAALRGLATGG